MKKMILTAAAALFVVLGVAPTFASDSSSNINQQSANIQAGGAAYPAGVADYLRHK